MRRLPSVDSTERILPDRMTKSGSELIACQTFAGLYPERGADDLTQSDLAVRHDRIEGPAPPVQS